MGKKATAPPRCCPCCRCTEDPLQFSTTSRVEPFKSGSRIPFAEQPVARTFLALASCGPPVCTAGSRLAGSKYLLTLELSTEKGCGALGLLWPAGLLQVRARQAMGGKGVCVCVGALQYGETGDGRKL